MEGPGVSRATMHAQHCLGPRRGEWVEAGLPLGVTGPGAHLEGRWRVCSCSNTVPSKRSAFRVHEESSHLFSPTN